MRARKVLPLLLVVAAACGAPRTKPSEAWPDAVGDVGDPHLAALVVDHWEASLATDPFRATWLGDARHLGDVPDPSPRAASERKDALRELQRRSRAIDAGLLTPSERITKRMLEAELSDELDLLSMDFDAWHLDPLGGPQVELLNLTTVQPVATAAERAALVQRWQRLGTYVRATSSNLLRGVRFGRTSSKTAAKKCLIQVEALLETPPTDSPFVTLATGGGHWVRLGPNDTVSEIAHRELGDARRQRELRQVNLHLQDGPTLVTGTRVLIPAADDPLSPEERGRFLADVLDAVNREIYPAFSSLRRVIRDEVLPNARPDSQPGLVWLEHGTEQYQSLILAQTSLALAPETLHQFGLDELERIHLEMALLGERVFGTSDLAEVQRRLREDPAMHFTTRDEVEDKARAAFERANAALPGWFTTLPRTPCEVVRIPAFEEVDSTIAYYQGPAADGSRPGRYYINTFAPKTRPRYEAEVLAFHEAVPGHHLQVALAQELDGLPAFRRFGGNTAFVEGWALYTERLCDEMGLYSGDLDRLGVLSFDAWRASRLVVDTGLHAMRWSRQRAIDFLVANTLLAENNVVNEVDRYIAWPAQALTYKVGQREILRLRALAQDVQGDDFDIAEFHARVLENGGVSLAVLSEVIDAWLDGDVAPPALVPAEASAPVERVDAASLEELSREPDAEAGPGTALEPGPELGDESAPLPDESAAGETP